VLGIGSGYPFQAAAVGREFGKPLANMRDYLAKMTGPAEGQNAVSHPYAKIVAANGPKMLELSRDLADGATPSVVPPRFTAEARATLGPDKLLAIGLVVFLDDDRDRARATAQQTIVGPWSFPGSPYGANLRRLGYAPDDVANADTSVLDDVVAYGDATAIAVKVDEHLRAGADHVILTVVGDIETGVQTMERIAPHVLAR